MGACTFTAFPEPLANSPFPTRGTIGRIHYVVGTLTFSSSYATGGDTIPLGSVGLSDLELFAELSNNGALIFNASGKTASWDGSKTAPKALLYETASTQVVNATDCSTVAKTVILGGHR